MRSVRVQPFPRGQLRLRCAACQRVPDGCSG
ncbi:MAG TPA: hypothetical protein DCY26_04775 [Hyphomonas sp.]|nr:hypothetical protein [Hyphomonas sp.]